MATIPATLNLRIQRRSDHIIDVQFKDSDGVALNLTGWTAVAQVWDKERTVQHGSFEITYVDTTTGQLQLKLPFATTTSLPDESYYDVMLIDGSGLREFYLEGIIRASEGYSSP